MLFFAELGFGLTALVLLVFFPRTTLAATLIAIAAKLGWIPSNPSEAVAWLTIILGIIGVIGGLGMDVFHIIEKTIFPKFE